MNRNREQSVHLYVDYLRSTGYRHRAVTDARRQLEYFGHWAASIGMTTTGQVTSFTGKLYHDHLQREADLFTNEPIGIRMRRERLTKLRRFLSWLHREDPLPVDLSRTIPVIDRRGKINGKAACTTTNLAG